MKVYSVSDQAAFDALNARASAAMGLPYTPRESDRRGGGLHVPFAQARTTQALARVVHPVSRTLGAIVAPEAESRLTAPERALLVAYDDAWKIATGPTEAGQGAAQVEVKLK